MIRSVTAASCLALESMGLSPMQVQTYPEHPITFIVPLAPGGIADPIKDVAPIVEQANFQVGY